MWVRTVNMYVISLLNKNIIAASFHQRKLNTFDSGKYAYFG
ncbi:MAG: hypothetical protein ABIG89_07100 [Candidatus Woesearchaeota archaeon]